MTAVVFSTEFVLVVVLLVTGAVVGVTLVSFAVVVLFAGTAVVVFVPTFDGGGAVLFFGAVTRVVVVEGFGVGFVVDFADDVLGSDFVVSFLVVPDIGAVFCFRSICSGLGGAALDFVVFPVLFEGSFLLSAPEGSVGC